MASEHEIKFWDPRLENNTIERNQITLRIPDHTNPLIAVPPAYSAIIDTGFLLGLLRRFSSDKLGFYVFGERKLYDRLERFSRSKSISDDCFFLILEDSDEAAELLADLFRRFSGYEFWYFSTFSHENEKEAKRTWNTNPDNFSLMDQPTSPFRLGIRYSLDIWEVNIAVSNPEDFDNFLHFIKAYPMVKYPIVVRSSHGRVYSLDHYDFTYKLDKNLDLGGIEYQAWDVCGRPSRIRRDGSRYRAELTSLTLQPIEASAAMHDYAREVIPSESKKIDRELSDPLRLWEIIEAHLRKRNIIRKIAYRIRNARKYTLE